MYSLLSLFIIIPLIFSHTFSRLGEYFIIENGIGNFESVKVHLFFVLLFVSTLEYIIVVPSFFSKKTLWVAISLLSFLSFEQMLFGPESFLGIGEKQHGSLFFASLIWFAWLLSQIPPSSYKLFKRSILLAGFIVACSAILEFLFSYNIFSGSTLEGIYSWGSGRATATLGNPNYVAGFLLMLLPIAEHLYKQIGKTGALLLIFSGILATGSLIGIFLSIAYMLYLVLGKFFEKKGKLIALSCCVFGVIVSIIALGATEKWLSLSSRFILMQESFLAIFQNGVSFVLGRGPNGIIEYYDGVRSSKVDAYFPSNMIIDSSHNVFVDLMFKFGIFVPLLLIFSMRKYWSGLTAHAQHMLILGTLFFSLNVMILSVYLLFIFAFLWKKEQASSFAFSRV